MLLKRVLWKVLHVIHYDTFGGAMASRFIRRLASGVRAASIEPGLRPGNTGGPVYGKNLKGSK